LNGITAAPNKSGGKFNFKIKIIQTDLSSSDYMSGVINANSGRDATVVSQNSSYISKLFFINNYSGGILAKDKIEDMPARYRRFIRFGKPSEKEFFSNLKKEMAILDNREEIGQNVFYSSLSTSPDTADSDISDEQNPASVKTDGELLVSEISKTFEELAEAGLFTSDDFINKLSELAESEEWEDEEDDEEYYDYEDDDEEIKNILHMNDFFDSDTYKMSNVKYDFTSLGNINVSYNGEIDIKYDESEITGIKDSYIQFMFNNSDKNIITIRRKHFLDTWLTLEKGKRISVEKKRRDFGSIETASTKELVNNMTADGGSMRISYVSETNGVPMLRVSYLIHAEPVVEKQ